MNTTQLPRKALLHMELQESHISNQYLIGCIMMTPSRFHLKYHSVTPPQQASLHRLTKPQVQGHRMDSSKAPTKQPPTASHQTPPPHNHKLTAESVGNWGGRKEG